MSVIRFWRSATCGRALGSYMRSVLVSLGYAPDILKRRIRRLSFGSTIRQIYICCNRAVPYERGPGFPYPSLRSKEEPEAENRKPNDVDINYT